MELYSGQLNKYEYNIITKKAHSKNKKGEYAVKELCENIFTFDIETTSAWLENGKIIGYKKGKSAEYWNSLRPISLCYIWQFSVDDTVYYGRNLKDFKKVLSKLPKVAHTIIWVHNLSFEFMFLANILTWDKVFARNAHKPIKAVAKEFPNIEFRCSYTLTRLSLATWGEQLGVLKAVGDLDYEKMRTPLTPLSEKELNYAEMDCRVVTAGIRDYLKRYKYQKDIPLTQTGTVRREVKDLLMSDPEYCRFIKTLVPRNSQEYKMLMDIFSGGYTHANRFYSGNVIEGLIEHYDFTSSYPTVMISEKYPMTPWVYIGKEIPEDSTFEDCAYIIKVKFTHLVCQTFNTYLQASKCSSIAGGMYDNGRVMEAESVECLFTEQDFLTLRETYTWEEMEVVYVYRSYKKYLPKLFIEYILKLYKNKTELKDVEGFEDLYMQSKQYINSMFGMTVTAIIQSEVVLDGDNWITLPLTEEMVDSKLYNLKHGGVRDKKYFLSYSWGCWVTAYARRNLWKCMIPNDMNVIYVDTDSIFLKGKGDFTWYNNEITEKLRKSCEINGIDFELTRPLKPSGKPAPLGLFTKEDDCEEFITLGAKRYVERRVKDGELHLTVSGINKGAVVMLEDNIYNFTDGFNFDKDDDSVTKKLCTYIVDQPVVQFPDGFVSDYKYGINLRRNGYVLTMTDEYKELINFMNMTVDDLGEEAINRLRAIWSTKSEEYVYD